MGGGGGGRAVAKVGGTKRETYRADGEGKARRRARRGNAPPLLTLPFCSPFDHLPVLAAPLPFNVNAWNSLC